MDHTRMKKSHLMRTRTQTHKRIRFKRSNTGIFFIYQEHLYAEDTMQSTVLVMLWHLKCKNYLFRLQIFYF